MKTLKKDNANAYVESYDSDFLFFQEIELCHRTTWQVERSTGSRTKSMGTGLKLARRCSALQEAWEGSVKT